MTTAPRRPQPRPARSCRRLAGPAAALALASALAGGCCQHQPYYVPVQPGCPPVAAAPVAAAPAVVRYGEVCQAPAGTVVEAPGKSTPATASANAPRPRVVVSEPSRRVAGRSGWRRSDPESIATRVEGSIDDDAVNR